MDQTHFNVFDRVGKTAEFTIFTLAYLIWIEVAEFGLVFLTVVESFNSIVSSFAPILFWALICLGKFAELGGVKTVGSAHVLLRMEIVAGLMVVSHASTRALQTFELTQDQVADKYRFSRLVTDFERL